MTKHKLHPNLTKSRLLRQRYLLAASGLCFLVFLVAYRQNNVNMLHLRTTVFETDKQNGDTETALRKLREYVYSHMNTDLATNNGIKPPIQLQYRYERLTKAEKDRASAINGKIYTDAQNECERLKPEGLSGSNRIVCIQEYVNAHGTKEQAIPDALYKFDFVSPRWSPDLAGWSLVATLAFLGLFIASRFWHGQTIQN